MSNDGFASYLLHVFGAVILILDVPATRTDTSLHFGLLHLSSGLWCDVVVLDTVDGRFDIR